MDKTTRDFEVKCFMTNQDYRLRAAAFLDEAQDMALQGSDELGFGYDKMDEHRLGWVLYRMYMKFLRPVTWRDRVTMNTWHKGMEGLVFLRDFELIAEDGQCSAVATSSWVVLDMDKRSFVRKEEYPDFINTDPQCTESAVEFAAPKVVIPSGLEKVFAREHKVKYSDTDFNRHTNNVKYVVWALDSIDQDFVFSHPIQELAINFNRETRLGDDVELWTAEQVTDGNRVFYVEGVVDGRQVFIVKLVF